MSLLRALRAYVGLGPDEDYEEQYYVRQSSTDELADVSRSVRTRRGTYLDDYYRSGHNAGRGRTGRQRAGRNGSSKSDDLSDLDSDDDVIDIRTARIDTGLADGSEPDRVTGTTKQRRSRIGDRNAHRQQSLNENEELLDQLATSSFDDEDDFDGVDHGDVDVGDGYDTDEGDPPEALNDEETGEDDHSQGAVVRSIDSARSRPRTLNPESFSDAKHVADEYKRGTPVVINLQGLERELARRLVDFASGICYALDGSMEKLAPQVFLLTPEGLDVSDTDRRRIEERGYAR